MDPSTFERLFEIATAEEGHRYAESRNAISAAGQMNLPRLQAKSAMRGWTVSLTADMITAWIATPQVCNQVASIMRGSMPGRPFAKPITGDWPSGKRAIEISALGAPAVPRVLEILTKTREYASDSEQETLLTALGLMKDPRAVQPLIALLGRGMTEKGRIATIHALGQIRHPDAVGVLSDHLRLEGTGLAARRTAAKALGMIRDPRSTQSLVEAFSDRKNPTALRTEAASALGVLGDPSAGSILADALDKEQDTELLDAMLGSLGEIGSDWAFPYVDRLALAHSEEDVRAAAADARRAITERLKGQQR